MVRGLAGLRAGHFILNQINVSDERARGAVVFVPIIDQFPPLNLRIVRRVGDHQVIPGLLANAIQSAVEDLEPSGRACA